MVDGVHGVLDHVVKLVVVENRNILDCVTIPNLHVEGKNVKDQALMMLIAMNFAVQVRYAIYVALFVNNLLSILKVRINLQRSKEQHL